MDSVGGYGTPQANVWEVWDVRNKRSSRSTVNVLDSAHLLTWQYL